MKFTSRSSVFPIIFLLYLHSPLTSQQSDVIKSTCASTSDSKFCIASLSSIPSSSINATVAVYSLSTAIIKLANANATNTSAFAANLSRTAKSKLGSLLRTCADQYTHSHEALEDSVVAMTSMDYDSALVHVSAAKEYPNVCHVLFKNNPGLVYPAALGKKEDVLGYIPTAPFHIFYQTNRFHIFRLQCQRETGGTWKSVKHSKAMYIYMDKFRYLVRKQFKLCQGKGEEHISKAIKEKYEASVDAGLSKEDQTKEYQEAALRLHNGLLRIWRLVKVDNELRVPVTKEEIVAEVLEELNTE